MTVAIRGAADLSSFADSVDGEARVLAAVRIGGTRLIDNLAV
jgi:pantothenate synthetase